MTVEKTKPFGRTDVIFQGTKLYIEGIQVPFNNIVINSGIAGPPSANITIPPQAGLMDIARFYQPKVHIFFDDRYSDFEEPEKDEKKRLKLLFSGIITAVSYSKSKTSANAFISFTCEHKYSVMNDCLVDYSGWLSGNINSVTPDVGVRTDFSNSGAAIIDALKGISSDTTLPDITLEKPDVSTTVVPAYLRPYTTRLYGMAGVVVNFWNQLKRAAFTNKEVHAPFIKLYRPLIEQGLQFFQRMAGHYLIEKEIQKDENRVDYCYNRATGENKILLPPISHLFMRSPIQADLTVSLLESYLQNSGEVTSIHNIFSTFFSSIDYDMLTLASPAEIYIPEETTSPEGGEPYYADDTTYAVDTLVKPRLPFYFSPSCNVLFPNMYHTISVSYDEGSIPTRVDAKNVEPGVEPNLATHYRAPNSVREAIAKAATGSTSFTNLKSTIGNSFGGIGAYEQGRGIKVDYISLPRWLSMFSTTAAEKLNNVKDASGATETDIAALAALNKGWKKRYPKPKIAINSNPSYDLTADSEDPLNPWGNNSGLAPHQKMLVAAAEYSYTQTVFKSKAGTIEAPFNPFIVPGYPMDIIEANPTLPSFHAYCASVTHSISSNGASTSISFVAGMTYSELANYYIPFVLPYLQYHLGLAENPTMLGNPEAEAKADLFYKYSLGVGCVAPDKIYNFEGKKEDIKAGTSIPQKKSGYKLEPGSGASKPDASGNYGELNPNLTYEGNLYLTSRPIENMQDVEKRNGIKFIDMTFENYPPTAVKYTDAILEDETKLEPGASQFLQYNEEDYLKIKSDKLKERVGDVSE